MAYELRTWTEGKIWPLAHMSIIYIKQMWFIWIINSTGTSIRLETFPVGRWHLHNQHRISRKYEKSTSDCEIMITTIQLVASGIDASHHTHCSAQCVSFEKFCLSFATAAVTFGLLQIGSLASLPLYNQQ